MSRRILHIIDSLGRTGTARQLFVLAQGLLSEGYDVQIAALDGRGTSIGEFAAAGVPTVELNRRWPKDPIACARLHQMISRARPEIIHTWSTDACLYAHLVTGRAKTSSLIVGQHRIEPWRSHWQWSIERWLAPRVTRFVANSRYVGDWCVKNGLPAEKFDVILPGVPPARAADVSRAELLRELQLPENARLIGVVGRLAPEKRVQDLIWAADLLRVLHDNLRLLVIGDGPLRQTLEQYARLASDLDHIRFLGERADLWRIMPHLDILWNATENRGHSIAILEAMAAGVPVIATDTPFNRDFVVEDETGYLVALGQRASRAARARHTDRIFTDRNLANRLADASRKRVAEKFDAQRMIEQYAALYQRAWL